MKHEEILTALEEISDKHIKEAEKAPKKKRRMFLQKRFQSFFHPLTTRDIFSSAQRVFQNSQAETMFRAMPARR